MSRSRLETLEFEAKVRKMKAAKREAKRLKEATFKPKKEIIEALKGLKTEDKYPWENDNES